MSVHNACGVEIRWADRDAHRVHPPLEYTGNAYIVGSDNIVRNVATYKIHVCDPEQIAAWTRLRSEAQAQREWLEAHGVSPSTEVCIDNLEMVIHGGWRNFPGWIAAVTITAEPWVNQTFHESVRAGRPN